MTEESLHGWARALLACTFVLICAGGLVTSRDAGLAVPDWPLSFGTLNPPRWYTIENVRTEHGHRLIAGVVALFTLLVAFRARRLADRPPWTRRIAYTAAVAVLLQALLGGLRVLHLSIDLAMVHGWLAQMFLCIVVSLAVTTSPGWRGPRPDVPRHIVAISVGITLLVICQLVLGIVIRHSGPAARPLSSYSVFYWHLGLAASTTVASLALWSSTRASRPGTGLRDRARSLLGLLLVQIALGIAAWWATEAGTGDRSPSLFESWVPTLHVLAGAGVLAYSVALTMHAVAGRATREAALRSSTMEAGVG